MAFDTNAAMRSFLKFQAGGVTQASQVRGTYPQNTSQVVRLPPIQEIIKNMRAFCMSNTVRNAQTDRVVSPSITELTAQLGK